MDDVITAWARLLNEVNDGACQRWQRRAPSWRRTSEGGFNPARYRVAAIGETVAAQFVQLHHYSGSYPAAKLRYGLLEGDHLVGVAVLGVPMSVKVLTNRFPYLQPYRQSLELSRLVLLDDVPANAESWFLSRVFKAAAGHGLRGVVSFSDPLPRQVAGRLVMPGHVGTVYQALNARYVGRATARTLTVLPDGTTLPARAAQKVRAGEPGAGGVRARLARLGAAPLPKGEDPAVWLTEQLRRIGARPVRHGGNHTYEFSLTSSAARLPGLPYPKLPDPMVEVVG